MSAFASEKYLSDADAFMASAAADDGGGGGGGEAEPSADESGDADAPEPGGDEPHASEKDEEDCFSVFKGNVAFASAVDGWAFRPDIFARIYAAKLGCSPVALQAALWGDWYYQPKTKRIVSKKALAAATSQQAASRAKPLFVQLALEPLWQLYAAAEAEAAAGSVEGAAAAAAAAGVKSLAEMAASLGVGHQVPPRDLSGQDRRVALRAVLRAWLPLSTCILDMVVQQLPDPRAAAQYRMPVLSARSGELSDADNDRLDSCLAACDAADEQPCLAFVSKMFAAPQGALPGSSHGGQQQPDQEVFLAFCRVFSGTLKPGATVAVLPPGWTPGGPGRDTWAPADVSGQSHDAGSGVSKPHTAQVEAMYLMMGRSLVPITTGAPAGSVVALAGLDTAVLKCATLVSVPPADDVAREWPALRPFKGMFLQAAPVVRVALEPARAADVPYLLRGLRLLNRADPSVEVAVGEGGETLLGVAGEVHLERCLKDLRERFARVAITASAPLVSFKESACGDAWAEQLAAVAGDVASGAPSPQTRASLFAKAKEVRTPNGWVTVKAVVAPLPEVALSVLDKCSAMLASRLSGASASRDDGHEAPGVGQRPHAAQHDVAAATEAAAALRERLAGAEASAIAGADVEPAGGAAHAALAALSKAWAMGPKRCGPNLLLSFADAVFPPADVATGVAHTYPLAPPTAALALGLADPGAAAGSEAQAPIALEHLHVLAQLAPAVLTGFQLACERGPLCDEALWGCVFDVRCEVHPDAVTAPTASATAEAATDDGTSSVGTGSTLSAGLSGQVIDCTRKALRLALEAASPRLVEQFYLCVVTTTAEALGGTYTVLHRRRARVLSEVLREGSGAFVVTAHVPVAHCFGLADELRQHTQGAAAPQLVLSHWARLGEDPQWLPTTEEEREEWGADAGGKVNAARRTVDAVRRRKGLPVEEKLVASGTKQRTQARKK
jgi:ribosome assembly protein 1